MTELDLTCGQLDLIVDCDGPARFPIQLKNADGTYTDFTACTADLQIRAEVGGPVLLEASTANGKITITEASEIYPSSTDQISTLAIALTPADTLSVPPGVYRYGLTFTPSGGIRTPIIEGSITFVGAICQ